MIRYYFPIFIVVFSNVIYDVAAKSIPAAVNAQVVLFLTYSTAAIATLLLFFITAKEKNYLKEIKKVNKAVFLLAIGVFGIDLGYVLLFRAGWDISVGSLVCNIALAVAMILIGLVFYKEKLRKDHVIGIVCCLSGFLLINLG